MKTRLNTLLAMGIVAFAAVQASAQLPTQPTFIPPAGDYGVFSLQDQAIGASDPDMAKAYDNFTLTSAHVIDGISWSGIYAEPMPGALSDTDFIVEIFAADGAGLPDVGAGPVVTFNFEGGPAAGFGGPDLSVTPLGHTSPATGNVVGGGPAYLYDADVAATTLLAGDYWISIVADQRFDNATPVVDPEWMWHLGVGPKDGFRSYDRTLDPSGSAITGIMVDDKDLAFSLRGTLVPEPSAFATAFLGLAGLGLIRRKR